MNVKQHSSAVYRVTNTEDDALSSPSSFLSSDHQDHCHNFSVHNDPFMEICARAVDMFIDFNVIKEI